MSQEYRPVDLLQWCNAGVEVLGVEEAPTLGEHLIRGLPFLFGDQSGQPDKCFLVLDSSTQSVTIPIGEKVTNVVVAHRLATFEGPFGTPGAEVAEYVFRSSDGRETRELIRERFEIGYPPAGWMATPFRAFSDRSDKLLSRYEGRFDETGFRQTEATFGRARTFHLWVWRNPDPDHAIDSLEIHPLERQFIVAGVTLGFVDEHPFIRSAKREIRIDLKDHEAAERPFDLSVEVDRGVTTFTQPLPEAGAEDFLAHPLKAWGEPRNTKSSPAYAEIAAIDSATVTVKQRDIELGKFRWRDVETGVGETDRVRIELLDRGKNWVHVDIVDDESGKPVPCRVHFRSPEGIPYQPHGHHNHVNSNLGSWHIDVGGDVRLGQITYAYIDGTCQGWLPRGEVIVDVARGFEYEPLRTKVNIVPGQRELTLRLRRWIDMNDRGWFSGDSHVHFLSTQGAHFESRAEDLNVVNMLQSQWGSLFTNTEEFTGKASVVQDANNIVYYGQENRQHFLGHLTLWGLKQPVMPWCSDGPDEAELGGTLETTLSYWADECHEQGGTVIIPHFPGPYGEQATLVATGRADAIEMLFHDHNLHDEYYRYLNCGYRLPLVGGTDKMDNDVPVGLYRTYADLGQEEFTYENWCRAVASGRTFLSGGPMIGLSVDGKSVGDVLEIPGPGTVEVEAWAESIFPIHTLQVVESGKVVASVEDPKGARRLEINESIRVDRHTWFSARCAGPDYSAVRHFDGWGRGIFAHTSPVYVACGGPWWMFDKYIAQYLLTLTEGDLTYIRDTAAIHRHGGVTHHHGQEDHLAYLERPFLEAREALQRRMTDQV